MSWLVLRIAMIFIGMVVSLIGFVLGGVSRKHRALNITVGIIGIAVTAISALMDIAPDVPIISISEDRTSVEIESDSAANIKYHFAADEEWLDYKDAITNITENTVVTAKATFFLTKDSDPVEMEIKVDDNTGLLYRLIETEKASVADISVEYLYRDFDGENAGNDYIGYHVHPEDFKVTGTDTNGQPVYISSSDCTYTPEVLTEDTTFTVSYEGVNGKVKKASVHIDARTPELASITASLRAGVQPLINTELTNDDFVVRGKYEDGTSKLLGTEEYTISPDTIIEGENIITVAAGNKTATVDITGSAGTPEQIEHESNDDYASANLVGLNTKITGKILSEEDVDYFKINIVDEKGTVILHFGHEKFDESSTCWRVSFFTNEDSPIASLDSNGQSEELTTQKLRLTKGIYYICVRPNDFRDTEYWLEPEYEAADEFSENEPDDDYSEAYPITELGTRYVGNIYKSEDKDFYKFTTSEKGKVTITFDHDQSDRDGRFWDVALFGENDQALTNFSSTLKAPSASSDALRLPTGTYYIKVTPNNFDGRDYGLQVDFEAEGDGFETEPNNDYGSANALAVGGSITGNIGGENDVDFYKIDLSGGGNLNITFSHPQVNNSYTYWRMSLLSSISGEAIADTENYTAVYVKGQEPTVTGSWTALEPAVYYLKVERDSYSNADYSISVGQ